MGKGTFPPVTGGIKGERSIFLPFCELSAHECLSYKNFFFVSFSLCPLCSVFFVVKLFLVAALLQYGIVAQEPSSLITPCTCPFYAFRTNEPAYIIDTSVPLQSYVAIPLNVNKKGAYPSRLVRITT